MIIKSVESRQFAGLRDVKLNFGGGLNVEYGKNEAGKSTVINLLYSLLFREAALDDRRDKDFRAAYFPAERKNGEKGDYIDGRVEFSSGGRDYALYKRWGKGASARCELETEGGIISDPAKIAEILSGEGCLKYGRGIFDGVIFENQKNRERVLKDILDPKKSDLKTDLSETLSRAIDETGGISAEKLKEKINEKIAGLAFRWDEDRGRPEKNRGIDDPWAISAKNGDCVLKAYYELSALVAQRDDVIRYERAEEREAAAKEAFDRFARVYPALQRRGAAAEKAEALKEKLEAYKRALKNWSPAEKKLSKATELKAELDSARAKEICLKIAEYRKNREELLKSASDIGDDEIKQAKRLEKSVAALKGRLSGMNVSAELRLAEGYTASAVSAVDGRKIDLSSETLNEAAVISVDGVMKLLLSPADVDVRSVKAELKRLSLELSELLKKYGAADSDSLSEIYVKSRDAKRGAEAALSAEKALLSGLDYEEIERAAKQQSRRKDEIERELYDLCGGRNPDQFIGSLKSGLEGYAQSYGSAEELKSLCEKAEKELERLESELAGLKDIPSEYEKIPDPEAEYNRLNREFSALSDELRALAYVKDRSSEEINEEIERKSAAFSAKKEELRRWRHISAVLEAELEKSGGKPLAGIEKSFGKNLSILSEQAEVGSFDGESSKLYSRGSEMSAEILSEGTKDTVLLAFRLAVIDSLYPEGGGLCVLDDPFTEMDKERCERACALLKEFSKRHQVIFFTCDEKYEKLLGKIERV